MSPTFSTERTVLNDRSPRKRYPVNFDKGRGHRPVHIRVRARRVEVRLKVTSRAYLRLLCYENPVRSAAFESALGRGIEVVSDDAMVCGYYCCLTLYVGVP